MEPDWSAKKHLVEPEKEKKTIAMSSVMEKPEAKVKEKSSYKKLIANLQTTYPDLSQEDALKGILALRVQNNGTLTGMTMLEIMERVIQFARPAKEKIKEEIQSIYAEKTSTTDSEKENSYPLERSEKSLLNHDDEEASSHSLKHPFKSGEVQIHLNKAQKPTFSQNADYPSEPTEDDAIDKETAPLMRAMRAISSDEVSMIYSRFRI